MQVTPLPLTATRAPDTAEQFSAWVGPHWPLMAALARRLGRTGDWEDVLQESLTSAWRKRAQFDPAKGTPRNWLLAVTADQARKSTRRPWPIPVRDVPDQPAPSVDHATGVDLDRSIARLTGRQQLAVTLHYFLGLSMADLAAVMACSEGTVKSTLSDARKRIRTELGEDYR